MKTASVLTRDQKKEYTQVYTEGGRRYKITVTLRYDDECGNGHNDFAMTGDIYRLAKNGEKVLETCGCIHDEIAKHFPKLRRYIKWHLTSAIEPMYYIRNTVYFAGDGYLESHEYGI